MSAIECIIIRAYVCGLECINMGQMYGYGTGCMIMGESVCQFDGGSWRQFDGKEVERLSTISSQLKIRDCFPYQMRHLTIAPEDFRGWVIYIKWVKGMWMNTPPAKLSAFFALPCHQATRLFQIMQSASYLPGYPNRHHPELGFLGGSRD